MKQKRLLYALGWVKDEYIEEMLSPAMEREHRGVPKKKLWLIAAVIAALLLTGCAAVILMRLEDLTMHQEIMTEPNAETTWVRTSISLQGVAGSPTFQATKEWEEFLRGYDTDNKIIQSTPSEEMDQGEEYYSYNCYTREMADKIDEICEKYGLQRQGRFQPEQSMENICHVLKVDQLVRTDENFEIVDASGYMYRSGTFDLQGSLILCQMEEPMTFDISCISKTDFNGFSGGIGNIEEYIQWNVTTADGVDVLLALGKEDGLMMADMDGYFCNVFLHDRADSPYDTEHESRIRKEDLEDLAQRFNFSIRLGPVSDEDWAYMEDNKIEYESTPQFAPPGTYPGGSFEDRVRFQLANKPNPEELEYALVDIDGNGISDLLIGRKGIIRHIYMTDGENAYEKPFNALARSLKMTDWGDSCLTNASSYIYICEDNKAVYVFEETDGSTSYMIAGVENGEMGWTQTLQEVPAKNAYYKWVRDNIWQDATSITKAEFDEILSTCVPIDIPMTPLTEYPLN